MSKENRHHPDPEINAEIEMERLVAMIADYRAGLISGDEEVEVAFPGGKVAKVPVRVIRWNGPLKWPVVDEEGGK